MNAALVDFCTFSGGGKLKLSKQHYVPEGFPAFSAAGQDGYVSTAEFHAPAIVVSAIGARCGKAFLADGAWTSLANTYCVFPDTSRADPRFLWYQLNDENSWKKSGTAQPFIKPSDIKQRQVVLPPLEEQRRIVRVLDRAAEIRRRADTARTKARAIIPALFLDMFGDPTTLIERWGGACFENLVSSKLLGLVRSTRHQSETGAVGYVRMNAITIDGRVLLNDLRRTDVTPEEAASHALRPGDLLFNTRNSYDLVGKIGLYAGPPNNVFNNNIMRLRFDNRVSAAFLNAYFQTPAGQASIKSIKKGTTSVCAIYYKDLAKIEVPLPPLPLQNAFGEQAHRLETIATNLDSAVTKAEAMAAALSAEVFKTDAAAALCDAA